MNQSVTNTEFVRNYKTLMEKLVDGSLKSITIKQKTGQNLVASIKRKVSSKATA